MTASQLVSSVAWNTAAKALQLVLQLVALALIGRYAGAQAFGAYALCWVVVGLFEQVFVTALSDSLIQQPAAEQGHFDSMLVVLMTSGAVFALAVLWHSDSLLAALGGGALLAAVLPWRALLCPVAAAGSLAQAKLARAGQFKRTATLDMAVNLVSSLLGIGLAAADYGIWSLFWMEAVRIVATTVGLFAHARWWPRLAISAPAIRQLVRFSTYALASNLLHFASRSLPRLLIGHGLGAQALGYYAMAERLCDQVLRILVLPGYDVAKAAAARARHDRRALHQLLWGAVSTSSLFAYPALLGAIVLLPLLIPATLGSQWQAAVLVMQLTLVANLRMPMTAFNSAILIGVGKPQWQVCNQLLNVILTALLCLVALPHGIDAVAAALILRGLLLWPIGAIALQREVGIPMGWQAAAGGRHLAAAALMALVTAICAKALALTLPVLLVALLCLPVAVVSYAHALAWLAPASWSALGAVARRLARGERGALKAFFVATASGH